MIKSLVTGGAGFIGSNLVDELVKKKHKVIVLDNFSTGRRSNLLHHKKKDVKIIKIDISNTRQLDRHFRDVDYVFHLAGIADIVPSIENPNKYFQSNVVGTLNVVEAAKKANIKKFIYAASASCYGIPTKFPIKEDAKINPMYPYAFTKWQAEELIMHWVKIYNFPAISIRFFNAYGPRSRTSGAYGAVFGVFLAQKLANKPLTIVGNGNQTRDFIHVYDVCSAFNAVLNHIGTLDSFVEIDVGTGISTSVRAVVELIKKNSNSNSKLLFGEVSLGNNQVSEMCANTKKLKSLGWKPKYSLEKGLMQLL